jgi:hypothetical protein
VQASRLMSIPPRVLSTQPELRAPYRPTSVQHPAVRSEDPRAGASSPRQRGCLTLSVSCSRCNSASEASYPTGCLLHAMLCSSWP